MDNNNKKTKQKKSRLGFGGTMKVKESKKIARIIVVCLALFGILLFFLISNKAETTDGRFQMIYSQSTVGANIRIWHDNTTGKDYLEIKGSGITNMH